MFFLEGIACLFLNRMVMGLDGRGGEDCAMVSYVVLACVENYLGLFPYR